MKTTLVILLTFSTLAATAKSPSSGDGTANGNGTGKTVIVVQPGAGCGNSPCKGDPLDAWNTVFAKAEPLDLNSLPSEDMFFYATTSSSAEFPRSLLRLNLSSLVPMVVGSMVGLEFSASKAKAYLINAPLLGLTQEVNPSTGKSDWIAYQAISDHAMNDQHEIITSKKIVFRQSKDYIIFQISYCRKINNEYYVFGYGIINKVKDRIL